MNASVFPRSHALELVLLGLQVFQVFFLWVHDWVPLGQLNDVAAVRAADSRSRLVFVTLLQSLPFTYGLYASLLHWRQPYPRWLDQWLLWSYAILLVGQLRAWWLPYLLIPDAQRAARYQVMFGNTHAFLPVRNGLVPNTAHILLHIATAATLVCLLVN